MFISFALTIKYYYFCINHAFSLLNLIIYSYRIGSFGSATSPTTGPPSLQQLCEESVALALVDPRTALQVLEYSDLAGAHVLRAYCISVAVCNLDAVLVEARGAFEELQPHLLAEIERVYKAQLRGPIFGSIARGLGGKLSGGKTAGAAVTSAAATLRRALELNDAAAGHQQLNNDDTASQPVVRGPRRRLQATLRPTSARSILGDLNFQNGGEGSDEETLAGASGGADAEAYVTQRIQELLE